MGQETKRGFNFNVCIQKFQVATVLQADLELAGQWYWGNSRTRWRQGEKRLASSVRLLVVPCGPEGRDGRRFELHWCLPCIAFRYILVKDVRDNLSLLGVVYCQEHQLTMLELRAQLLGWQAAETQGRANTGKRCGSSSRGPLTLSPLQKVFSTANLIFNSIHFGAEIICLDLHLLSNLESLSVASE